ncbi:MAG: hypothetical protein ACRYF5_09685, partial [Janthinobacterium lividum]
MSDKINDQISIPRPTTPGQGDIGNAANAKQAAQLRARSTGPSDEVTSALNKDALTVVRSQGYDEMIEQLVGIAKKYNLISTPANFANISAEDQEFIDAFDSVVAGAVENSRMDINALYRDMRNSNYDQYSTNRLTRNSLRQFTLKFGEIELNKQQEGAGSRKLADMTSGATGAAAGFFQIFCGVVSVGVAAYQATKLPKLNEEIKGLTNDIKTETGKMEAAQKGIQQQQVNIDRAKTDLERTAAEGLKKQFQDVVQTATNKVTPMQAYLGTRTAKLTQIDAYLKVVGGIEQISGGVGGLVQGLGRVASATDSFNATLSDI